MELVAACIIVFGLYYVGDKIESLNNTIREVNGLRPLDEEDETEEDD